MGSHSTQNPRLALWDERFRERAVSGIPKPATLLAEAAACVPAGRALDIASGTGRHALFLAERGFHVDAVDGSSVGLSVMMEEAATKSLSARITAHHADLESEPPGFMPGPQTYDLIADFFFLHRPLFELIRNALKPGGIFAAAIHVQDPGGSSRFALNAFELDALVRGWGWEVLSYQETEDGESHRRLRTGNLIARKPRPAR